MKATLSSPFSSVNSVCIRCGNFKREFQEKCSNCGFEPETDTEIAQSRVLAPLHSFAFGSDGETADTGRTIQELRAISAQIAAGQSYQFPPEELARVLSAYQEAPQGTPRSLWLSMSTLLIGALAVLGGIAYFIYAWPK